MRRVLFSMLAVVALAAVGPATAVAKHHSKKHHGNKHSTRAHPRVRRFGTDTTPAAAAAPTDNAGTVVSFDSTTGALVLKLNDNSTVSGTVNSRTELRCESAQTTPATVENDFRGHDGPGGGDNNGNTQSGDQQGSENQQAGENEQAGEEQGAGACTPAPGNTVREAELSISSAGSIWKQVDLLQ